MADLGHGEGGVRRPGPGWRVGRWPESANCRSLPHFGTRPLPRLPLPPSPATRTPREAGVISNWSWGLRVVRFTASFQHPLARPAPPTGRKPLAPPGIRPKRERTPPHRPRTQYRQGHTHLAPHSSGPLARFSNGLPCPESRVERSGIGAADATAGSALYSGHGSPTLTKKRAVRRSELSRRPRVPTITVPP